MQNMLFTEKIFCITIQISSFYNFIKKNSNSRRERTFDRKLCWSQYLSHDAHSKLKKFRDFGFRDYTSQYFSLEKGHFWGVQLQYFIVHCLIP